MYLQCLLVDCHVLQVGRARVSPDACEKCGRRITVHHQVGGSLHWRVTQRSLPRLGTTVVRRLRVNGRVHENLQLGTNLRSTRLCGGGREMPTRRETDHADTRLIATPLLSVATDRDSAINEILQLSWPEMALGTDSIFKNHCSDPQKSQPQGSIPTFGTIHTALIVIPSRKHNEDSSSLNLRSGVKSDVSRRISARVRARSHSEVLGSRR
mmetsp:Transcript_29628/g.78495  ORF Transcript_29628/g.78495 Transcript_29628/m.78495 type:complete len:211 (-) Transcript_29628:155-787(-)